MGEHTPGPWVLNPFSAQVDCDKPSKLGGLLPIAQMLWPTDERSEEETEANAQLIAAAPTMAAFIQKRADEGDLDAIQIMEAIHGNA
ncbi:hypothetical protein [Sphingomonas xinjiangensis]|uniref:Uncharacterized protein n=1 Tax=Sphingomonas xinjiangensis TaxID=643568 RepID=A0A840YEV2_9SPHN|nr:hypothetical protein [Sphingomonas xinjiangensis]MBB5709298.1 hypothetical protein [Sphingomonas xinjiangensis]